MKTKWKVATVLVVSALSANSFAGWQCIVSDQGGHRWMSPGMTKDHANTVAMSFCTAYSPASSSCHETSCLEKDDMDMNG